MLDVGAHVFRKNDMCHDKGRISPLNASIESARQKDSDMATRTFSGVVYPHETLGYSIALSRLIERIHDNKNLLETLHRGADQWYMLIFTARATAFLGLLFV
jgi:hypothetical protein